MAKKSSTVCESVKKKCDPTNKVTSTRSERSRASQVLFANNESSPRSNPKTELISCVHPQMTYSLFEGLTVYL